MQANVTSLAIARPNVLLWGDYDGVVHKLDLDSQLHQEFKVHNKTVMFIQVTDDNRTVVTRGFRDIFAAFDFETFAVKWQYEPPRDVWTSIALADDKVFVGIFSSVVVVLDVNTGEIVRRFSRICFGHASVAVTPTGPLNCLFHSNSCLKI